MIPQKSTMDMGVQAGPIRLLLRAVYLWLTGRMHFPKGRIGERVCGEREYIVFREMVVEPARGRHEESRAIFRVQFKFARMSVKANERLSLIPAPFIAAQPGFRSKLWTIDKSSGEFQGIYEWDTLPAAESYLNSFPMRLMKKRAVPGSVHYEVLIGHRNWMTQNAGGKQCKHEHSKTR